MVEGAGLENRCTRKGIVGSNPTLSVDSPVQHHSPHSKAMRLSYPPGWPGDMLLSYLNITITIGREWQSFASASGWL